jgi:predicted membrane-bound spermidine synthase
MRDISVDDSARAAFLFSIGTAFLLLGAALGLNSWPVQSVASALWRLSGTDFFLAVYGFGIMLTAMFWCSRPSRAAQWTVMLSWPPLSVILWRALDLELHFSWFDTAGFPAPMLLATAMSIPATLMLVIRLLRTPPADADQAFETRLRYLAVLSVLFMMVPHPALTLTATLHPHTFDMYALHWDEAAGLTFTPWIVATVDSFPLLPELVRMAYGLTPIGFMAVALLHLRKRPSHVASGLLTWVGLTTCALIAYNFFPITGPKYLFGSNDYTMELRRAATLPLELVSVGLYPRNGMPSMHFGWMLATCILWWRSGTAWWSRAILIAMAALTAIATLYLGEHYVVDLIVAVPFVLAAIALCTTGVPLAAGSRRWTAMAGFGIWAAWIVILRNSIHWIVQNPWVCWVMILATMGVVAFQVRWMRMFAADAQVRVSLSAADRVSDGRQQVVLERRLGLMFFASGAAALVYQVLFAKQLALVFGSTATATFTVLATFLGGMAIGSLIGGRLALRTSKPLVAYAFVEMLIAGYCIVTPVLFRFIQEVYVALASGYEPGSSVLLMLRVALGATVLLIPTMLMGVTLPLLTQVLAARLERIGTKVAWLYFANTAGAASGALLTSYAVIPLLGASRTNLIAAMLNLLVALGALEIAKRVTIFQPSGVMPESESVVPLPHRAGMAALLSLGIGGILSLGLEVVYVHMLSIVAGNSVYAFGLMLATFLLGLAGGGETARRLLLQPDSDRMRLLAWSLLGLAASVAAGVWWWNGIPEYFASFAQHPAARSFGAREAIRGVICAFLMIPPTVFIGAAYAFGMDIATSAGRGKPVATLGLGAALNTLGNISGVLLFGFGLLPLLGGLNSSRVIALGALLLAATVLLITTTRVNRRDVIAFVLASIMIGTSVFANLNYDVLSSGANVYFYPQRWGAVSDHAESIDGGLTAVAVTTAEQGEVKTLLTNGKFQGNNAWKGEMQAQLGFAIAPLLHQDRREWALVIGYGTGVTSRVFHEAGFRQLDIAELSRDVVNLADKHFADVNKRVSSAPGVQLHVTDGRNLLLLSSPEKPYDIVSIEITSIWFAGAASLYNREFYALARSRMAADGVLQQWLQLHRLAPTDLLTVIASLRAEFRYVSLYVMGGQGILIATNSTERSAPNARALQLLEQTSSFGKVRGSLERPISAIAGDRLLDDKGIDRFLKGIGIEERLWWSTDDNLLLEYSTPKANVNDASRSYQENLGLLSQFR